MAATRKVAPLRQRRQELTFACALQVFQKARNERKWTPAADSHQHSRKLSAVPPRWINSRLRRNEFAAAAWAVDQHPIKVVWQSNFDYVVRVHYPLTLLTRGHIRMHKNEKDGWRLRDKCQTPLCEQVVKLVIQQVVQFVVQHHLPTCFVQQVRRSNRFVVQQVCTTSLRPHPVVATSRDVVKHIVGGEIEVLVLIFAREDVGLLFCQQLVVKLFRCLQGR